MADTNPKNLLYLFNTDTKKCIAQVYSNGLDIFFPDHVRGWSDVLDARIPPYNEQSLDEVCSFAQHVRKYYILVTKEWASKLDA